ncbi:MAG: acetate--CoA ligase [Acidimicrobiales bacterium]
MSDVSADDGRLSALLQEHRSFPPSKEVVAHALVGPEVYERADKDRLGWWAEQASLLKWDRAWDEILDWKVPFARWFVGGKLNASVNCLDRHVEAGLGDRVAFHWVGEPEGERRTITYRDLKDMVCRAANALSEIGVRSGDRVAIYLPMIPEAVVAMLACARLGAPHSVVFGGFSAEALAGRIIDLDAQVLITADGGFRRGTASGLKVNADEALKQCPNVSAVVVVRRTGQDVEWKEGRDMWWHELVDGQSPEHAPDSFDSEHPLYVMYTSGTTAKPKGILHTTGGYLTHVAATQRLVFDLHPEEDIYWTAADIGWVTGHSYIVYGPLTNGTTSVMYEGTPDAGGRDRWWKIVEEYKVSILYTAPTTVRTLMKWGEEHLEKHDLSSLRILGSVGEPINPEAWMWYRTHVGSGRCPVVDTWWQTETGGIMITPLPGITAAKPGAAMTPFPGVSADVVDNQGHSVGNGEGGYLVLTEPWPGMLRGIWGDDERYKQTYWSRFEGRYFAGDGAKRDDDGDLWLLGRIDDVMNVSGHRISTTEIEHALVGHPAVVEAAVVGASDATTGQAVVAFVTVREEVDGEEGRKLVDELRDQVATTISPIAKPRQILLTPELPKTRSGKIMRRLLRDVAENREPGDVTTLLDPSVVNMIDAKMRESSRGEEEEG